MELLSIKHETVALTCAISLFNLPTSPFPNNLICHKEMFNYINHSIQHPILRRSTCLTSIEQ